MTMYPIIDVAVEPTGGKNKTSGGYALPTNIDKTDKTDGLHNPSLGDTINEETLDEIKEKIRKDNKRTKTAKLDHLKIVLAKLYMVRQDESEVSDSMILKIYYAFLLFRAQKRSS